MRSSLFWRAFVAFITLALVTTVLCTFAVAAYLRSERMEDYENEVRSQAEEIAADMSHLNTIGFVQRNTTMQYVLRRKCDRIKQQYGAEIWIVNYASGVVEVLDRRWTTSEQVVSPMVQSRLYEILGGSEIRAEGLFPDLGEKIVTIGVPWRYSDGTVVGAVLLHIPTEDLDISYADLLKKILPVSSVALVLGIVLSYILARSQSGPIKKIGGAVERFAGGDLTSRVELTCGGELQALGDQINQMAQALNELEDSRRSFVANVSHELRSPLTSMRGYVQGMLDGTIPREETDRYLGVVMEETQRLTTLVNDLLDLSRIESGKFPMEKASYDLTEQIRRVIISFGARIDEKEITVEPEFPDGPVWVNADRNRISQVISNLVDNAIKFLPGSGGVLRIAVSEEGDRVLIRVGNNGEPIPEQDQAHVFDRFYKADKAHTSGKGTGLGLAIVKSILDQHGETIRVISDADWTEFSFTLEKGTEYSGKEI